MAKKKPAPKKKKLSKRKSPAKKKSSPRQKAGAKTKPARKRNRSRAGAQATFAASERSRRGLGAESGGQAGDDQGLSRRHLGDSESVEELVEEGQYLEADAVSGVEDAKDPDESEVRTREVPEDDVPSEYTDPD